MKLNAERNAGGGSRRSHSEFSDMRDAKCRLAEREKSNISEDLYAVHDQELYGSEEVI